MGTAQTNLVSNLVGVKSRPHWHLNVKILNLTFVRTKDDLEQGIKFFLAGMTQIAEMAIQPLKKITDLKPTIEKERVLQLGKRSQVGMIFDTATAAIESSVLPKERQFSASHATLEPIQSCTYPGA